MRRLTVVAIVVALSAPFLAASAPTVEALEAIVEGEERSRDAGECAGDGESITTWTVAGASGGRVLAFPETECWAEWDVSRPTATSMRIRSASGGGAGECTRWDVHVDGAFLGTTASQCSNGILQILSVPGTVPAGLHTIRVTARITSGTVVANSALDYLSLLGPDPVVREGETRDRNVADCTVDAEVMTVWSNSAYSAGSALVYPENDCWAEWDMNMSDYGLIRLGAASGGGPSECTRWEVTVDQTPWGITREQCTRAVVQRLDVVDEDGRLVYLPPGPHTIRVTATYTSGDFAANAVIDYLHFEPTAVDCTRDSDEDGLGDCVEDRDWARRAAVFCNVDETVCSFPHTARQDVYVEVDWMPNRKPSSTTLSRVFEAYALHNIWVHFDAGELDGGSEVSNRDPAGWDDVFHDYFENEFEHEGLRDRDNIYHYLLVGCRHHDPTATGSAMTPGHILAVWKCAAENPAGGDNNARVAHSILHELSHNILGRNYFDFTECTNLFGTAFMDATHNPDLGHFTEPGSSCSQSNADVDYFTHSSNANDVLCYCSSDTLVNHEPRTWSAMKPWMFLRAGETQMDCGILGVDVILPAIHEPPLSYAPTPCGVHLDRIILP